MCNRAYYGGVFNTVPWNNTSEKVANAFLLSGMVKVTSQDEKNRNRGVVTHITCVVVQLLASICREQDAKRSYFFLFR